MMGRLEAQMKEAARNLEFERAAALRDEILQLRRLREELAAAPGTIPADVYAAARRSRLGGCATGRACRTRREVFSVSARPNVIAAGSRRRPPRRRRPASPAARVGFVAGTMPHAIFVETGLTMATTAGLCRRAAGLRGLRAPPTRRPA